MRRGRLAGLAAVVAVAALGLAACDGGSGAKSSSGPAKSIKVVIAEYSKDHTRPSGRRSPTQYTKQTGVKVDLQVVDWNAIDQQVSTMIQNNQPPDVLNLNSFSSYAKDGLLYPADEVLSPRTREDFLDAFARGGKYQGKLYGFPILASARAFFYNKDLSPRPGIAGPPKTWDEFVAAARKIQALGGGVIGYALPLGPEEAQAEWSIWMWNNGGDWKSGGHVGDRQRRRTSRRAPVPRRPRQRAQGHPGQPRQDQPHRRRLPALQGRQGRDGDGLQPARRPARRRGQGQLRGRADADQRRARRSPSASRTT